jgi:formate-dependent nitrite reductase membrane component NrfD
MNDIPIILFSGSLLIYTLWLTISLERFRSRNAKNKGILRRDLRRIRIRITLVSLLLPILSLSVASVASFLLGQGLPSWDQTLPIVMVCPGGLWLFSMLALWSFTQGWQVIHSQEDK